MDKTKRYTINGLLKFFKTLSSLKEKAYEIAPLCTNITSREEITGIWFDEDVNDPMVGIGVWSQDCGNDAYWIPLEYFTMTVDEIEEAMRKKSKRQKRRIKRRT